MQKAKPRTPAPSFFQRKECLHRTVKVSSPDYIQVLVLAPHPSLPGPAGLSNIPILPASKNLVEPCHDVLLNRIGWEGEREMGSSHLLAFVSYCPRVKKKNKKRNLLPFSQAMKWLELYVAPNSFPTCQRISLLVVYFLAGGNHVLSIYMMYQDHTTHLVMLVRYYYYCRVQARKALR